MLSEPRMVLFGVALVLAGLSVPASEVAAGDSPWSVRVEGGESSLERRFGTRFPKFFDDDEVTLGLAAGYRLNRFLALEAAYHDMGDFLGLGSPCPEDAEGCIALLEAPPPAAASHPCAPPCDDPPHIQVLSEVEAELSGLSLSLLPRWPLGDRFAVYGRLGVISWEADVRRVDGGFGGSRLDEFSGEDLLGGVGIEYALPVGLALSLEHRRVDLDYRTTNLGLSWRF